MRRILNFVPLSPPKANTIFLAQTFFLGDTRPHRTRSVGRGRSKCPSYHSLVLHPPTPYTLSPLEKGGEGRGEGGIVHPCTLPLRGPPRDLIPP